MYGIAFVDGDYLEHHGIEGQKWGRRRYQNPDGTLTEEGKLRYAKRKSTTKAVITSIAGGLIAHAGIGEAFIRQCFYDNKEDYKKNNIYFKELGKKKDKE